MCNNLKLLGACNKENCNERHVFSSEVDRSATIPRQGKIEFKLSAIHNVTKYSINLINYTDESNNVTKWKRYTNTFDEMVTKLSKVKECPENIMIDNLYAHQTSVGEISRVRVMKYTEERDIITHKARYAIVYAVDSGETYKAPTSELFELPERYKKIPEQAIEVYLANSVPLDGDTNYSTASILAMKKLFKTKLYDNDLSYFTADVLLQVGNVLWIDNVYLMELLESVDITVTKLNVKKQVFKDQLARFDMNHLQNLFALCKKCSFDVPDVVVSPEKSLVKVVKPQATPAWAFLTEDEYNYVYMPSAKSPQQMYITNEKFNDL